MREPSIDAPFLLIPGPVEVHPEVAAAALQPMIGHRGPVMRTLFADVTSRVQSLLRTRQVVLPLACSATGAMEAAVRNAGAGTFLHVVNGAFGERWSQVRAACGFAGDEVRAGWGEPMRGEDLARALAARPYDAVTIVHSETSTGVLNPLADLAAVVRAIRPEALLLVDAVTSMAAVALDLDAWDVDVCFAGSQKAWGLPPGLTLCTVSERALARSRAVHGKGSYFDFVEHAEFALGEQTPSTPAVGLLQQLQRVLDRIDREGVEKRYARHRALQERVERWAEGRCTIFPRAGFRSPTLSVLEVGEDRPAALCADMRRRGWWIGGGYGATASHCVRIGHMGELDLGTLDRALADLAEVLDGTA